MERDKVGTPVQAEGLIMQTPADIEAVPEGVDLSEPIDVEERVEMPVMPAVISNDTDLITVLTGRLIELPETDPFYDIFIDDLSSQATIKWYKKGDFEMIRTYVQKNMGKVLSRFPDLAETRVKLAKTKMKKGKALRRKMNKKGKRR